VCKKFWLENIKKYLYIEYISEISNKLIKEDNDLKRSKIQKNWVVLNTITHTVYYLLIVRLVM